MPSWASSRKAARLARLAGAHPDQAVERAGPQERGDQRDHTNHSPSSFRPDKHQRDQGQPQHDPENAIGAADIGLEHDLSPWREGWHTAAQRH